MVEKASSSLIKETKKQIRENRHLPFLDNPKIIKDSMSSKNFKPLIAFVTKEEFAKDLSCKSYLVSNGVMESLVDVKTPQGLCVMTQYIQDIVSKPKTNFLVLDTIQDPGNAGTLIRTALATGFNTVILVDSVRVTNPKLVRSTVGAIFGVNIYEMNRQEFVQKVKEWQVSLAKADMNGQNLFDMNIEKQIGVVIGNEGNGVSDDISSLCDMTIKIPMNKGIESLNAGVSGSIIMYQINKDKIGKEN